MPEKISVRIDGEYVAAQEGQTILEVARANGKYIPTLCWLEGSVRPVGACRLCMVEVSGVNRLLPACTTPVQDGMSVTTLREAQAYRKIARVPVRERNHICAVCVSNNHCELQALAQRKLGVTSVRYRTLPEAAGGRFASALRAGPQPLHPVHALRAGVREMEGAHVWDVSSRGIRSHGWCAT
jgi:bidirectional [NiFe] hydrogenase diaphorase subunit